MADIRLQNIHKAFGDFVAIDDSNFTVPDGEFFVILGPSGCGKTTTLRMIAGLEMPTSGKILSDNEDITFQPPLVRDIAFVFQHNLLYPHLNVRDNIAYPLKSVKTPKSETRRRVEETADLLRIGNILSSRVSGLSPAMRLRVALGRAIVRRPKAILIDEPMVRLDTEAGKHFCSELLDIHKALAATIIYVTHNQSEAMSLADKIAVMNNGLIEQFGAPQDIYDQPATAFVAQLTGAPPMNFLSFHAGLKKGRKTVKLSGTGIAVPELREDVPPSSLALGVRPEHVVLDDNSRLKGRVVDCEYMGTTQIISLHTTYGLLKARLPSDIRVRTDEIVGLGLRSERLSIFDSVTGRALRTALTEANSLG